MSQRGCKIHKVIGVHAKTKREYRLELAGSSPERVNARGEDVRPAGSNGLTSVKRELEIAI